jgi:hypothetical protein
MITPDRGLVAAIEERGAALRARIAERTDRDVRIVCVTKAHPPEVAAAARAAGFVDLGENYAQELRDKDAALRDKDAALRDKDAALRDKDAALRDEDAALRDLDVRWHFIGRLQSNKVRLIAGVVDLWQTVDRASLVDEIARRAPGARVLVQLDLAGLPGRGGCDPADAPALVERARAAGLVVEGLMGVGPPGMPEDARPGFARLVALADELGLPERSIGMSADLDVAVEEGATIVRVGTALVGPRTP